MAVAALVTLVVLGAGVATAGIADSGSGQGKGTVGRTVTATIEAASGPADLLPGGTGSVYFTLANTNPVPVSFESVTAASVVSGDPTACPSDELAIAPALPYALGQPLSVAAWATSGLESLAGFVELDASAPSGCQGVVFTVTLTLFGAST